MLNSGTVSVEICTIHGLINYKDTKAKYLFRGRRFIDLNTTASKNELN